MDIKKQKPAQKVTNEPFEIIEDAIDQITGSRPSQPFDSAQGQGETPTSQKTKPGLDEKKKVAILTAHRRELDEIVQLQKKRQEEMRARWSPSAKASGDKEAEPESRVEPLVEPTPKAKRGIFGGMLGNIRKKQRSVELPKTPTN